MLFYWKEKYQKKGIRYCKYSDDFSRTSERGAEKWGSSWREELEFKRNCFNYGRHYSMCPHWWEQTFLYCLFLCSFCPNSLRSFRAQLRCRSSLKLPHLPWAREGKDSFPLPTPNSRSTLLRAFIICIVWLFGYKFPENCFISCTPLYPKPPHLSFSTQEYT